MKHTYMIYESVASPEICNDIIKNFNKDDFGTAVIGFGDQGRVDTNIRNTGIQWAKKNSLVECILARYIMQANQEALWNFNITEPEQVQIGRYKEGQFYGTHMDCYVKGSDIIATGQGAGIIVPMINQRKISASLLLNDESEYEGGDLVILDEVVKVKKQGTIIVFPSFMAHQVTPITSGVRYSAVCWMAGPKWK